MTAPLWTPSPERIAEANLTAFIVAAQERFGRRLPDRNALWRWSWEHMDEFWALLWDFAGVIGDPGDVVVSDADAMPGARFFPEGELNFAENLLRPGTDPALVFQAEDGPRREVSRQELRTIAGAVAAALREHGVQAGDRVAAFLPNIPETMGAMLGAASLGAVWSSCSPDFGVQGVVDRFGQIEPVTLICADGYVFKGHRHDSLERVAEILEHLPSVRLVIVVPYLTPGPDLDRLPNAVLASDLVARHDGSAPEYARLPFNHPLYVLFSSGTTGKPKCIVHGTGGTLLKHLYEHQLMCDVHPGDRVFYFTTLGWMMWNWLVSGLASQATLLLYDGNPMYPHPEILWDYFARERGTCFGTSAKYIDALRKTGVSPRKGRALDALRTLTSTGSPLVPEGFEWVYRHVKEDVCLSSISGGTDIVGCFVGGDPIGPVWAGEIQARSLGMATDVVDEDGNPVRGEKGELICRHPFPSMPLGFWDDPGDTRYRAAYFERFPGVWHHGDFAEITEHDGVVIYGRSDATLNPGGIRIGTAEIYRVVESLPEIEEAIVVGQEWDDDTRIVLFVKLRSGHALDDELRGRVRTAVREGCSPRHVPAVVLGVSDIPRTKSGKIVEIAVREVIHGRPIKNVEALANPEALDHFRDRSELAS